MAGNIGGGVRDSLRVIKNLFRGKLLFALAVVAIGGAAAWLRFDDLSAKPLHADEAEQAYTLGLLLNGDGYRYNPVEHHGPALYYFAATLCRLAGQNSYEALTVGAVRCTPAVFGVVLALLPLLCLRRRRVAGNGGVGMPAVLLSLAFAAISPVAVYYARYFIQETMFVACFWGAVVLLWRALTTVAKRLAVRNALAAAAGVLLGLAVASKETWVLMAAAAVAGGAALILMEAVVAAKERGFAAQIAKIIADAKGADGGENRRIFVRRFLIPTIVFVFTAMFVAAAFFSSFGENPQGVVDSLKTYYNYANKASGGAHGKPFGWYFALLWDPEPFARDALVFFGAGGRFLRSLGLVSVSGTRELFTGIGCLVALVFLFTGAMSKGERRAVVFALVSGGVLLMLYSFITYKTPWLMLGVLPPLWLAAGTGFAVFCRWSWQCLFSAVSADKAVPKRIIGGGVLLALSVAVVTTGVIAHASAARFLSTRFAADMRNPLAYVHTTEDAQGMARLVMQLTEFAVDTDALLIRVISDEYWPLPWYMKKWDVLRGRVGFWRRVPPPSKEAGGELLDAPVVITDENTEKQVAPRLRAKYVTDFVGLRPGVLLNVRIREDLHQRLLAARIQQN
ncbi:MAG: TIGR03663 family protein [Puniceicoccales bacterium]|nr:TIGR03663 family protein [Puniceicoccales bacterium]